MRIAIVLHEWWGCTGMSMWDMMMVIYFLWFLTLGRAFNMLPSRGSDDGDA